MRIRQIPSKGCFYFLFIPAGCGRPQLNFEKKKNCKTHFSKWQTNLAKSETETKTNNGGQGKQSNLRPIPGLKRMTTTMMMMRLRMKGWLWWKTARKTRKGVWKWNKYKQTVAHSRQLNLDKVKWTDWATRVRVRSSAGVALRDSTVWQL